MPFKPLTPAVSAPSTGGFRPLQAATPPAEPIKREMFPKTGNPLMDYVATPIAKAEMFLAKPLAAPLFQTGIKIGQAYDALTGKTPRDVTDPLSGARVKAVETPKEIAGRAAQTIGLGLGPTKGMALFGAGNALSENKDIIPKPGNWLDNVAVDAGVYAGIGKGTELGVGLLGAGLKALGGGLKTLSIGSKDLTKSAEENYSRVLGPTTKANKIATKNIIAPGLAKKEVFAWTRQQLLDRAEETASKAGEVVDSVWLRVNPKTKIDARPVATALYKEMDSLVVPAADGTRIIPQESQAYYTSLKTKLDEIKTLMDRNGKINAGTARAYRQGMDSAIQASKPYQFGMGEAGTKLDAARLTANETRGQIAKDIPGARSANREFNFWNTTKSVLDATLQRTQSQAKGKFTAVLGGIAGLAKGGLSKGIEYAIAANLFNSFLRSTAYETGSAIAKLKLAQALEKGESKLALKIMQGAFDLTGTGLEGIGSFLGGLPKAIKNIPRETLPGTEGISLKEGVKNYIKKPRLGMSLEDVSKNPPSSFSASSPAGTPQLGGQVKPYTSTILPKGSDVNLKKSSPTVGQTAVYRGEGGAKAGQASILGKGKYYAQTEGVASAYGKVTKEIIDDTKFFDGTKDLPDDVLNEFAQKYSKKFGIPLADVEAQISSTKSFVSTPDYYSVTSNMNKPRGANYVKYESEVADVMNEVLRAKGYEGVKGRELLNDKYTDNIIYNKFPADEVISPATSKVTLPKGERSPAFLEARRKIEVAKGNFMAKNFPEKWTRFEQKRLREESARGAINAEENISTPKVTLPSKKAVTLPTNDKVLNTQRLVVQKLRVAQAQGDKFAKSFPDQWVEQEAKKILVEIDRNLESGEISSMAGQYARINNLSGKDILQTVGRSDLKKNLAEVAPKSKAHIDTLADSVAKGEKAIVFKAPIKEFESAVKKLEGEKSGNLSAMTDLARNSIITLEPGAKTSILKKLADSKQLASPITNYIPEKSAGFEGAKALIKTPNGQVAEIQILSPKMFFGKMNPTASLKALGQDLFDQIAKDSGVEPGLGHKIYKEMEALAKNTEVGYTKFRELYSKSVDYYSKLK